MSHPNILWICTDQQRFDTIAALGNSLIRTPNIDRLVAEGVAFTQAYAQSPVCTPSRAAMLTGRYPRTTRCRQNGQQIPADERLLPRILADHGYFCGLAGKLHLSSCANGRVEQRIDDGYQVFHWSHHPQPDWAENAYTQWLAEKGKTWDELYTGEATRFIKRGIPAEYHQTTWCAEMACEFLQEPGRCGNALAVQREFLRPASSVRSAGRISGPLRSRRHAACRNIGKANSRQAQVSKARPRLGAQFAGLLSHRRDDARRSPASGRGLLCDDRAHRPRSRPDAAGVGRNRTAGEDDRDFYVRSRRDAGRSWITAQRAALL